MEIIELWVQLKSHLASLNLKLSNGKDEYIYLAYLALMLFRLDTKNVIIYVFLCSVTYEILIISGDGIGNYYTISSIFCSYATIYYFNQNNRVCIGLAVMTAYMFLMGQETLINALISEQFYNTLYDSYEICVSAIHLFIISLFIKWRRVFNILAEFIHDTRSGSNGVNNLFSVL